MKALFRIALALSLVLGGFSYFLVYSYQDSQRLDQIEKTSHSQAFYLGRTSISADAALAFFHDLSSRYHVSVVKSSVETDEGRPVHVKSGIFDPSYPFAQWRVQHGSFTGDPQDFVASYETGDAHQTGTLSSFAQSERVVIRPPGGRFCQDGGGGRLVHLRVVPAYRPGCP